jgi:hypothetical protein
MNTFNRFKLFVIGFLILFNVSMLQAQQQAELEPFTQAELEQILAPIALYPDTVLSHILIASTYPLEVIQAERWALKNTNFKGSDAVEAVNDEDWDPSVKALVAFPQILTRLSENLEWTQKLGDAFLQDEQKLLTSVQSLRQRAYENGNLDKMDKMNVSVDDDSSIIIEPRDREVVYVPYYDTRVVYGSWYWAHNPPVYWNNPHFAGHHYDRHHSPFYWGPRIRVSFGHFFSSFLWHDHHIVRIPYHHYTPHHYYDRHQIASHRQTRRWAHNPTHRRGVSYRSVTVSNRYREDNNSRRPSRTEVRSHREQTISTRERNLDHRANNSVDRSNSSTIRSNNSIRKPSITKPNVRKPSIRKPNTRIATPNRIREELRDGRISIKERGSRPAVVRQNKPTIRATNTRTRIENRAVTKPKPSTQTNRRQSPPKQQTIQRQSPPKQQRTQRSEPKERSSSRSNNSRSEASRSSSRSSNSNKGNRSRERR